MFHGEGEVFGEGVEESEVGFCVVFISEGSTSVVDKLNNFAEVFAVRVHV